MVITIQISDLALKSSHISLVMIPIFKIGCGGIQLCLINDSIASILVECSLLALTTFINIDYDSYLTFKRSGVINI